MVDWAAALEGEVDGDETSPLTSLVWAVDFQRALQARQAARQAEVLDMVKSARCSAYAQHLPRPLSWGQGWG